MTSPKATTGGAMAAFAALAFAAAAVIAGLAYFPTVRIAGSTGYLTVRIALLPQGEYRGITFCLLLIGQFLHGLLCLCSSSPCGCPRRRL